MSNYRRRQMIERTVGEVRHPETHSYERKVRCKSGGGSQPIRGHDALSYFIANLNGGPAMLCSAVL